ncbi:phosphoribosyl pyrophosphate synthase-associated protein 2-like [Salvelinus alpinus]|uniref:phosphoribosyl pyrophosphate synthase-associated protein 2-like n=1 Tax=Salvelinus alpinus TaxID=8036 RepID=UPI0039FB9542
MEQLTRQELVALNGLVCDGAADKTLNGLVRDGAVCDWPRRLSIILSRPDLEEQVETSTSCEIIRHHTTRLHYKHKLEGLSAAWVPKDRPPEAGEQSGRSPPVMNHTEGGLVIFSANSHPSSREISKRIGERLGVELGKVQVYQEDNRETRVQIQESVRGKDVFIIQTVSKDVNTTIMELLIMVYACRTSCARSITGVVPYFPYSKQCKMRKRGSIVSKLLASMMCKAGEDTHTERHTHTHTHGETHTPS